MSVDELLKRKEICVCAGSGGVGKTTTSAAIAAGHGQARQEGDRADHRPGQAAGRTRSGCPSWATRRSGASIDAGDGELWAMMLDAKRTFDDLVEWHAPDEETRDAVLGNRIYQELSNAVAGSQEYMAMEKLHELHQEGRYDLLVLDTPPTRNALDFLDAPKRLSRFIDSRSLQFFTSGGLFGAEGVLGAAPACCSRCSSGPPASTCSRTCPTSSRASATWPAASASAPSGSRRLLADSRTTFLLVTSPRHAAIEEAVFFHHRLQDAGMPFGAPWSTGCATSRRRATGSPGGRGAARARPRPQGRRRTWRTTVRLAERDRLNLERLRKQLGRKPMIKVPDLERRHPRPRGPEQDGRVPVLAGGARSDRR